MENERKVIFRYGFESFRGQSTNRSTNHTNGSMASTLELGALHYRRDHMVVQLDQPIPQGWESMQSLVRIGMQLFTIMDSIFVKGLVKYFDTETQKKIKSELDKIKDKKSYRCFEGIDERAVCAPIQDDLIKRQIRDTRNNSTVPRHGIDIVDPSGGVSQDIITAMRCINLCVSLRKELVTGSEGATFDQNRNFQRRKWCKDGC